MPSHHNLWRHFRRISEENRDVITNRFSLRLSQRTHPLSISLVLSKDPRLRDEQVKSLANNDPNEAKGDFLSLERVLKDTGESYNTWRYI